MTSMVALPLLVLRRTLTLWKVTDALSRETIYTYWPQNSMGAGQVSTVTLPGGAIVSRTYTTKGQLNIESGTGTYWKKFAYNALGELTGFATKADLTEFWTNWQRDAGTGLIARKSYGNTSATFENNNTVVNYGYNAAGRLTSRIWARGVTTTYGYTPAGEVNSISYSDGTPGASGMAYDKGGRLTGVTDASGTRTITFSNFDQRANETWTAGLLSGYGVSRGYTENRRTSLSATGPDGFSYPAVTYAYHPSTQRLTGLSQGNLSVTYTPAAGMLQAGTISSTWSGGGTLARSIGYDVLGRTTYATASAGGVLVSAHGTTGAPITYDAAGRRQTIPREDGAKWIYGYNLRNEVGSGRKEFADASYVPGHQFTYVYDGIGNRKQWKWGGDQNGENLVTTGTQRNAALNQYTSVYSDSTIRWITGEAATNANVFVNGAWAWRKGTFFGREIDQGNQTGPSWKEVTVEAKLPPSGGNMVVSSESGHLLAPPRIASCQYDLDGNLTNDGVWSYSWDGENRLKRITSTSTVPNAAKRQFDYTYDFEGRRVSRKVYTWDAVGQTWITTASPPQIFLYDGWNLIATMGDWGLNQRFVWGTDLSGTLEGAGGVGGLLAMTDVTAGKSYGYASDCNGNVSALVDSANQAVVARYEYGPFGELLRASGPMAKVNPFRFSTKYTDNESGLVGFQLRPDYNPIVGRFLSRDPIGELGGPNLYALCANDPVNKIDPLGLDFIAVGGVTVTQWGIPIGKHMSIFFIPEDPPCMKEGDRFEVRGNDVYRDGTKVTSITSPASSWDFTVLREI